jgi:hypothetical protein
VLARTVGGAANLFAADRRRYSISPGNAKERYDELLKELRWREDRIRQERRHVVGDITPPDPKPTSKAEDFEDPAIHPLVVTHV